MSCESTYQSTTFCKWIDQCLEDLQVFRVNNNCAILKASKYRVTNKSTNLQAFKTCKFILLVQLLRAFHYIKNLGQESQQTLDSTSFWKRFDQFLQYLARITAKLQINKLLLAVASIFGRLVRIASVKSLLCIILKFKFKIEIQDTTCISNQ